MESYFDGKLYKNKIWIGTVEGEEEETLIFFYSVSLFESKFLLSI